MRFPSLLRVAAPVLLGACSLSAPPVDEPVEVAAAAAAPVAVALAPAKAGDYRYHSARAAGVRFPVLRAGILVEERSFDPSLPVTKFRHSVRLDGASGTVVEIQVWDNPQRLDLHAWFAANLPFLAEDGRELSERSMTRAGVPGILVEHLPVANPTAAMAIFALGNRVFRVIGMDPEGDGTGRALFDRVVSQIGLEVKR